ncbi:lipocalin family protein [Gloeocapsa sp. PCC 73106]|uniref:lipocalin family protein n=1 Tax=Gloeocapsa sp. PCC 73106 TaxID=102232 RepID=UPI0002ABD9E6|nr:lipocalin family protein [Gloeocapsa sp. PCC 73106]ELR99935.1 bacterial lipocalin [Gloeocapsa sp. PCC 73106]
MISNDTMTLPPVETVDFVDLERYDGLWYEVAKTPNSFTLGCVNTTATYEIIDETSISVFNACNKFRPRGRSSIIEGVATVTDPETNAKLEVGFEGIPFPGEYWILDLVEDPDDPTGDYTYAVVGESTRTNLFILSRTPNADPEILEELYAGLEEQFFDTDLLISSPQFRRRCNCEQPDLRLTDSPSINSESKSYFGDAFLEAAAISLFGDVIPVN